MRLKSKTVKTIMVSIRISFMVAFILILLIAISSPYLLFYEMDMHFKTESGRSSAQLEKVEKILSTPSDELSDGMKMKYLHLVPKSDSFLVARNTKTGEITKHAEFIYEKTPHINMWRIVDHINSYKMNQWYRGFCNYMVVLILKAGKSDSMSWLVPKPVGFDYVKLGSDYYIRVIDDVNSDEWTGLIEMYTQVPLSFVPRFRGLALFAIVSYLITCITAFAAAFISVRDIFTPLDAALNKLMQVNVGMFNKRIPPSKRENQYMSGLAEQINLILERADQAIDSQQKSAREITHQVRTPLTAIMQAVDYIRIAGLKNEYVVFNRLDVIAMHVERISNMTQEIIQASNLESLKEEGQYNYNLSKNMMNYIESVNHYNNRYRIKYEIQENIYTSIPYTQILKIGDTLGENAVRYSFKDEEDMITLWAKLYTEKNNIVIYIKNYGIGIPEDEIDKIFRHSYRATNVRKKYTGTGLGLSGVKQIVDMYNGHIHVTSKNNITTFIVSLPNNLIKNTAPH